MVEFTDNNDYLKVVVGPASGIKTAPGKSTKQNKG